MAKAQVKMEVDLTSFNAFTKALPGVMDDITKRSFNRGGAKMRKGFIEVIDSRQFQKLESTDKYRSKYSKPLQMMKGMIRYKTTGGYKRITTVIGVFAGKAGRNKINSQTFKKKYNVTLARFAQIATYGGKLKIKDLKGIKRMIKAGFYIKKGLKFIKFPKRDWYTPNRWRKEHVIMPYIERTLNNLIEKKINGGLNRKFKNYKKRWTR